MARFINPQPQFFTDLGLPLSEGLLYFYSTETSTPLDTYSDPELTTPNPNPVQLDAGGSPEVDIWLDGVYKVILKDKDDNLKWEKDPVGGDTGSRFAFSVWQAGVSYNLYNIVIASDGNSYMSLVNDNINNDPTTSTTEWERIEFIRYYNATVTYSLGDVVQDTTGNMWRSKQNLNTNHTPALNSAWWDVATDKRFAAVLTASGTLQKNQEYLAYVTSAAADFPIPAMTAGDTLVLHNCMQSTQTVRLTNSTFTIRGKRGTATSSDNIVLAVGDTAILVARTSTDLEAF